MVPFSLLWSLLLEVLFCFVFVLTPQYLYPHHNVNTTMTEVCEVEEGVSYDLARSEAIALNCIEW